MEFALPIRLFWGIDRASARRCAPSLSRAAEWRACSPLPSPPFIHSYSIIVKKRACIPCSPHWACYSATWSFKVKQRPNGATLYWAIYVAVATAAVYTHYFAFFLLLALAIAYFTDQLFVLPRIRAVLPGAKTHADIPVDGDTVDGDTEEDADLPSTLSRRPILGFLIANLIVLLLYIPWITTLVNRFSVDSSYWAGQLKIEEAIRHVAISFISGETVLEREAIHLFTTLWPADTYSLR